MEEVYVKVIRVGSQLLVNICDKDLLGKTLKEGGMVLKLDEQFYGGYKTSLSEAFSYIRQGAIVSLVGNVTVSYAIKNKYVHPEATIKIAGVQHAIILSL